jgi:hypothetical protein
MNAKRSLKKLVEKKASGAARSTRRATLDVLTDVDLMKQIRSSQVFYKSGKKGLSFEAVFGEPLTPVKRRRGSLRRVSR